MASINSPTSGTHTATSAGAAMPDAELEVGVTISNASGEAVELIASGASTGYLLADGQSVFFTISNLSLITAKRVDASDQDIRYFGS